MMRRPTGHPVRFRGTILAAVMIIAALAGMVAAGLMFRVRADLTAATAGVRGEQAYAAALAGIRQTIVLLQAPAEETGGWYDNPDRLRNQFVWDDGGECWYFTVYAHNPLERTELRYGVTDESGKINLNTADGETLLRLPGMTEELVDCLMDFRDADDNPRPGGAEQEYYDQLPFPYKIKNAPLVTLEELLLVKGFNASLLYGEDANFNGLLDPNEDDGEETFPPDDSDGELDLGLRGLATAVTYEPNVTKDKEARFNINGNVEDLTKLSQAGLSDQTVQFIQVYRAEGNVFKHPSELLGMTYKSNGSAAKSGKLKKIPSGTTLQSGVNAENLAIVLDKLTTLPTGGRAVPLIGLVNVNTASKEALAALPGMEEDLAHRIVETRGGLDEQTKETTAWLYTEELTDATTFKEIAPRLTARGYQYRVQCVGFSVTSGRFRVLEALVDLAGSKPRIAYLRDITRLGMPMAISAEELGLLTGAAAR